MTPSIEEAIRSGAVRLVPVRATDEMMDAADRVRALPSLYVEEVYTAMVAASPDHTPALLALIEERDRLKVERDEGPKGKSWAQFAKEQADRALAAEAKCDALREALGALVSICRPGGPATPARAIYERARALSQETADV